MDALQALFTRKSVRKFNDQPISDEALQTILRAGMSGPSCVNSRDWAFIVVRDKDMMNKMADANGHPAEPLRQATAAILICGDLEKAYPKAPEYWVIDGSIATQNMILAAHAQGIGSVWLGTYPQQERVSKLAAIFNLPETIVPHSIIALGYPQSSEFEERDLYEEAKVHFEKW